ncbi:MAG: hypothetical protein WBJ13_09695 [Sedimentibacter sp.]
MKRTPHAPEEKTKLVIEVLKGERTGKEDFLIKKHIDKLYTAVTSTRRF